MIELFADKHAVYDVDDSRLQALQATLLFFSTWKEGTTKRNQFFSEKLWFDIQSMIHGFISLVQTKLRRFPGSIIKPAIINQDCVENHFCQLRGANGQNEIAPSYLARQCQKEPECIASLMMDQATLHILYCRDSITFEGFQDLQLKHGKSILFQKNCRLYSLTSNQ